MPAIIVKKERWRSDRGPTLNQPKGHIIVIGKKVSSKATERNRLKRRIRAILTELRVEGIYKIIVKPEAKNLTFEELKKQIERQIL